MFRSLVCLYWLLEARSGIPLKGQQECFKLRQQRKPRQQLHQQQQQQNQQVLLLQRSLLARGLLTVPSLDVDFLLLVLILMSRLIFQKA